MSPTDLLIRLRLIITKIERLLDRKSSLASLQFEHGLFDALCSVHMPRITKIVKDNLSFYS